MYGFGWDWRHSAFLTALIAGRGNGRPHASEMRRRSVSVRSAGEAAVNFDQVEMFPFSSRSLRHPSRPDGGGG